MKKNRSERASGRERDWGRTLRKQEKGEKKGFKRLRIKKKGLFRERRGVECGGEEKRVEG